MKMIANAFQTPHVSPAVEKLVGQVMREEVARDNARLGIIPKLPGDAAYGENHNQPVTERIFAVLTKEPQTTREIADKAGCKRSSVASSLAWLRDTGKIKCIRTRPCFRWRTL